MNFSKHYLFLTATLLSIMFLGCEKGIYNSSFNINCNALQNGIINSDSEAVISEINKLLYGLRPVVTSSDPFGHKQNINLLVERINNSCLTIRAELVCYACIETNPPQSEIELRTNSSDTEFVKILDIWTSPDEILKCRTIHDKD